MDHYDNKKEETSGKRVSTQDLKTQFSDLQNKFFNEKSNSNDVNKKQSNLSSFARRKSREPDADKRASLASMPMPMQMQMPLMGGNSSHALSASGGSSGTSGTSAATMASAAGQNDVNFVVGLSENLLLECRRLNFENSKLSKELQESKNNADSISKQLNNIITINKKLLTQEDDLKEKNYLLENTFNDFKLKYDQLLGENQKTISKNLEIKSINDNLKNELEDYKNKNLESSQNFNQLKQQLKNENKLLKSQNEQLNDENDNLHKNCVELKDELKSIKSKQQLSTIPLLPFKQDLTFNDNNKSGDDSLIEEPSSSPIRNIDKDNLELEKITLNSNVLHLNEMINKLKSDNLKLKSEKNELEKKLTDSSIIVPSSNKILSGKKIKADSPRSPGSQYSILPSNRNSKYDSSMDTDWEELNIADNKPSLLPPFHENNTSSDEESDSGFAESSKQQHRLLSQELHEFEANQNNTNAIIDDYITKNNLKLIPIDQYNRLKKLEIAPQPTQLENSSMISAAEDFDIVALPNVEADSQKDKTSLEYLQQKCKEHNMVVVSNSDFQKLLDDKDELSNKLQSTSNIERQIVELNSLIGSLKSEKSSLIENIEQIKANHQSSLTTKNDEVLQLKQSLESLNNVNNENLLKLNSVNAAHADKMKDIANYETQLKEKNLMTAEYEKEIALLNANLDNIKETHTFEIKTLNDKIKDQEVSYSELLKLKEELENSKLNLTKQCDDLQLSLSSKDIAIDSLTSEKNDITQKFDALEKEFTSKIASYQLLVTQEQELRQKSDQLLNEKDVLISENNTLNSNLEKLEGNLKEYTELLSLKDNDIAEITSDLKNLKAEHSALAVNLNSLFAEKEELAKTSDLALATKNEDISNLTSQIESLEADKTELLNKSTELSNDLDSKTKDKVILEPAVYNMLLKDKSNLDAEIKEMKEKITKMDEEHNAVLKNKNNEISESLKELEALKFEKDELIDKSQKDNENHEMMVKAKEVEIDKLNASVLSVESLLKDHQNSFKDLMNDKNSLEIEIKNIKDENEALSSKIVELESSYNNSVEMENLLKSEKAELIDKEVKVRDEYNLTLQSKQEEVNVLTKRLESIDDLKPIVEAMNFVILDKDEYDSLVKLSEEELSLDELKEKAKSFNMELLPCERSSPAASKVSLSKAKFEELIKKEQQTDENFSVMNTIKSLGFVTLNNSDYKRLVENQKEYTPTISDVYNAAKGFNLTVMPTAEYKDLLKRRLEPTTAEELAILSKRLGYRIVPILDPSLNKGDGVSSLLSSSTDDDDFEDAASHLPSLSDNKSDHSISKLSINEFSDADEEYERLLLRAKSFGYDLIPIGEVDDRMHLSRRYVESDQETIESKSTEEDAEDTIHGPIFESGATYEASKDGFISIPTEDFELLSSTKILSMTEISKIVNNRGYVLIKENELEELKSELTTKSNDHAVLKNELMSIKKTKNEELPAKEDLVNGLSQFGMVAVNVDDYNNLLSQLKKLENNPQLDTLESVTTAASGLGLVTLSLEEYNALKEKSENNVFSLDDAKHLASENGMAIITFSRLQKLEKFEANKENITEADLIKHAPEFGLAVIPHSELSKVNRISATSNDLSEQRLIERANELGLVVISKDELAELKTPGSNISPNDLAMKAAEFDLVLVSQSSYDDLKKAAISNDHFKATSKEDIQTLAKGFGLLCVPESSFVATTVSRHPDVDNVVVVPTTYYNKLSRCLSLSVERISKSQLAEHAKKRGLILVEDRQASSDAGSVSLAAYQSPVIGDNMNETELKSYSGKPFNQVPRAESINGNLINSPSHFSLSTNISLTDRNMIPALTQTIIGEYLHKYYRRLGPFSSISENRHERYFWIHPYSLTLYWCNKNPVFGDPSSNKIRALAILAVDSVEDNNPLPPGLYHKSIIVRSSDRNIKITCPTRQRHNIWYNSLRYLIERTTDGLVFDDNGEDRNDDNYTADEFVHYDRANEQFRHSKPRATSNAFPHKGIRSLSNSISKQSLFSGPKT
ncbi:hypothetical protein PACTADRAFT_81808 [Pachysolen tannophilus NRRL Y-2460]|uniref:PH domain-containing protein n=1 Tax=Pachysolen tannophilus NRRL Y-2460 TaxID=669874 RepID=A0A1E4TR06_PACTA|nr:hypothetical protein PACTADRAFT_81808 [Pachysolen tannophilus NRRL Y-2460]